MVSVMEVIAQIVLAPHLSGRFDDPAYIRLCIRQFSCQIPIQYRKLFNYLIDTKQDFPEPNEFSFFVSVWLNIPTTVSHLFRESTN